MAMNTIQFQPGLSLSAFLKRYGTEQQCEQAVVAARWPAGFRCSRCGCSRYLLTRNGSGRQLWQCFVCGYQCSSIAGTLMEHTHVPLRLWFLAMYLLTQNKNAISALALKRQLGVPYKTAWLLKHKILSAMQEDNDQHRLHDRVEIDDAYLGGERAGAINGGRKAANKTAFIAAVQTTDDGRPMYVHFSPVDDFTNKQMHKWAKENLAPGCHVVSDGTPAFARVRDVGAEHERHVAGHGRKAAQNTNLHWVNTILGNLKTSLAGTYHAFAYAKYARRYLAEFAWRFNNRFNLPNMMLKLLRTLVAVQPRPMRLLRANEVGR